MLQLLLDYQETYGGGRDSLISISIYKLTSPSGKVYVGQTRNFKRRLHEHKRAKSPVGYALRKYGLDHFSMEILWSTIDLDVANCLEKCAVSLFCCKVPYGYNRTDGGDGCVGHCHTEKTKRMLSERMIGNTIWKSSPAIGSKPMLGKGHSETTKKKISEALVGNKNNRNSPGFSGRMHSEESKCRIGKGSEGKVVSEITRKKMSDARKQYWQTRKHLIETGTMVGEE